MAKSSQSEISHLSLIGHKDSVGCVEWSHSLSLLASASDDGSVRLWDTRTGGKCVKAISAFDKNPVQLVAWAPPKSPIASSLWAACGRDLFCFDIRGNNDMIMRESFLKMVDVCEEGDNDDELSFLHVHPKTGEQIAVADDAGLVHILDLRKHSNSGKDAVGSSAIQYTLERGPQLASHTNIVTGALFRPSTLRDVVTGSLDGTLAGWDLSKPNKPLWHENMDMQDSSDSAQSLNPPLVHGIATHSSGRYFAAGLGDGSISVHAFSKGHPLRLSRLRGGHSSAVAQVHFSCFDSELLVSAGNDKRISFWRLDSLFQPSHTKSKAKKRASDTQAEQAEEIIPQGRLAHTEKINWLSSSTTSSSLHVADVSAVITVFDVSRM